MNTKTSLLNNILSIRETIQHDGYSQQTGYTLSTETSKNPYGTTYSLISEKNNVTVTYSIRRYINNRTIQSITVKYQASTLMKTEFGEGLETEHTVPLLESTISAYCDTLDRKDMK